MPYRHAQLLLKRSLKCPVISEGAGYSAKRIILALGKTQIQPWLVNLRKR